MHALSLQAEAPVTKPQATGVPALFIRLLHAVAFVKVYDEHAPAPGFTAQLVPLK